MKTFTTLSSFAALVATSVFAQTGTPIINTPAALVQCQPALITFSGGMAPYFLSVIPGGQVGATPLEQLPEQQVAGSFTWNVNLAAGTSITLQIRDSSGAVNYADMVTIQAGTSNACLGAAASGSASASTGGAAVATTATGRPSAAATTPLSSSAASTAFTSSAPSATVTGGSGTPAANVTATNGTTIDTESYNFTCAQGLVTYAISTVALPGVSLRQATNYFSNWTGTAPGTLVNSTGTGVNSNRTYTPAIVPGLVIPETLVTSETNRTSGSLHLQWNVTAPLTIGNDTVYSAFDDVTVYTNTTTNQTSLQWFILACPSNQTSGIQLLAQFIEYEIAYSLAAINGTGMNATAPASTTAMMTAAGARSTTTAPAARSTAAKFRRFAF